MKALVFALTILAIISPLLPADYRLPEYRLSDYAIPLHYHVQLMPYFVGQEYYKLGSFEGKVNITLQFKNNSSLKFGLNTEGLEFMIWELRSSTGKLHATNKLEFDAKTGIVQFPMQSKPSKDVNYTLAIRFIGNISSGHDGMYERTYIDNRGHQRWILATNLRRGNARKLFPCFDETRFLTPFLIDIVRPRLFRSFTNTDLITPIEIKRNRATYTDIFIETPRMDTSSLAFIVGEFKPEKIRKKDQLVTIHIRPDYYEKTNFSLHIADRFLKLYGKLFTKFELLGITNLRIVGIPMLKNEGRYGAWGLITLDDSLLVDPNDYRNEATILETQNIITSISHEVVYQWVGNAVTFDPGSAQWLSEGLSKYYEYFATHKEFPKYGLDKQFIIEVMHKALYVDSKISTRPMFELVLDKHTKIVSNIPHIIKSIKGASLIRMAEHTLEKSEFQAMMSFTINKGLKLYNETSSFKPGPGSNYNPKLWPNELENYFLDWTTKLGYPLLKVILLENGWLVEVTQDRYAPFYHARKRYRYTTPLSFTTNTEVNFSDTAPTKIFRGDNREVNIWLDARAEWVMFNIQQTSFYRVMYSSDLWVSLYIALTQENWSGIHEFNRAQFVDDLLEFGRTGMLSYGLIFIWLDYLKTETEYTPWMAAINAFKMFMPHLTLLEHHGFGNYILYLTEKVYNKLGVVATNKSESATTNYLRNEIVKLNCRYNRKNCTDQVGAMFHFYLYDHVPIPLEMESIVLCTGMKTASIQQFDMMYERFTSSKSPREKLRLRYAMGCVRNRDNIDRFFHFVLTGEVPTAEKAEALVPLYTENPENVWTVYLIATKDYRDIFNACESWEITANIIKNIAEYLVLPFQKDKFKQFVREKGEEFKEFSSILDDAIMSVNTKFKYSESYLGSLRLHLKQYKNVPK